MAAYRMIAVSVDCSHDCFIYRFKLFVLFCMRILYVWCASLLQSFLPLYQFCMYCALLQQNHGAKMNDWPCQSIWVTLCSCAGLHENMNACGLFSWNQCWLIVTGLPLRTTCHQKYVTLNWGTVNAVTLINKLWQLRIINLHIDDFSYFTSYLAVMQLLIFTKAVECWLVDLQLFVTLSAKHKSFYVSKLFSCTSYHWILKTI